MAGSYKSDADAAKCATSGGLGEDPPEQGVGLGGRRTGAEGDEVAVGDPRKGAASGGQGGPGAAPAEQGEGVLQDLALGAPAGGGVGVEGGGAVGSPVASATTAVSVLVVSRYLAAERSAASIRWRAREGSVAAIRTMSARCWPLAEEAAAPGPGPR
jgi:hypothetical protein